MIYFDGDSHTYGEELENPAQESFPKILSEKLGHEFVNLPFTVQREKSIPRHDSYWMD